MSDSILPALNRNGEPRRNGNRRSMFNPERAEVIINCLAEGNVYSEAAGIAGVSEILIKVWMKQGELEQLAYEREYESSEEGDEEPYRSPMAIFYSQCKFAQSSYWVDLRRRAKKASDMNPLFWQWEATVLERLNGNRFSKTENVNMNHSGEGGGGKVQVIVLGGDAFRNRDVESVTSTEEAQKAIASSEQHQVVETNWSDSLVPYRHNIVQDESNG